MRNSKGVEIMACNFRILLHQNSDSVHLKLIGDFDGSSAHELLKTIKTYSTNANKVFIHTDGLKDVHPFGKEVFHKNFNEVSKPDVHFIFTGDNGATLEP
jgi:anti-anti-sigma regulatory factor